MKTYGLFISAPHPIPGQSWSSGKPKWSKALVMWRCRCGEERKGEDKFASDAITMYTEHRCRYKTEERVPQPVQGGNTEEQAKQMARRREAWTLKGVPTKPHGSRA